MRRWNIEMSYGIGFTVSDIEAETQEEAIEKAKNLVEKGTTILLSNNSVDESGLEFEKVTFIEEE